MRFPRSFYLILIVACAVVLCATPASASFFQKKMVDPKRQKTYVLCCFPKDRAAKVFVDTKLSDPTCLRYGRIVDVVFFVRYRKNPPTKWKQRKIVLKNVEVFGFVEMDSQKSPRTMVEKRKDIYLLVTFRQYQIISLAKKHEALQIREFIILPNNEETTVPVSTESWHY